MQGFALLDSLTFFGAKKEAKKHPPPPNLPPIWGGLSEKSQKPSTFRAFWYRGTRDVFFLSATAQS